ncbi:MAG: IS66 family transposase [Acetobacteraceae bacterium]
MPPTWCARGATLKLQLRALIDRQYDTIVTQGPAFHDASPPLAKHRACGRPPRRVGRNLLLRLDSRKPDVLRFLTDPRVPFTNDLAEQDARMMNLRQKISGGFRRDDGAKDFTVLRSVPSTAIKQSCNILQALNGDPEHLAADLRVSESTLET